MDIQSLVQELKLQNESKIVLLVADGLGGLPIELGGPTELEAAKTPNLDALARRGVREDDPVRPRHYPRQRAGTLGLFGYDPVGYLIGRGALEATGVGFKLGPKDVAVSCNFCTLDAAEHPTAGRPVATRGKRPAGHQLRKSRFRDRDLVEPVTSTAFRDLSRRRPGRNVADTDPQETGVPPLDPMAHDNKSQEPPRWPNSLSGGPENARRTIEGQRADDARFRRRAGDLPSYEEVYGLKAAAIAVYPMYKGLAQLVGMEVVGTPGTCRRDRRAGEGLERLRFLLHPLQVHRQPGEDGNFAEKV